MTTTIARYPNLEEAFRLQASDNGMSVVDNIKEVVVPPAWQQRFEDAEDTASELKDSTLDSFLLESQLGEEAQGDEYALEYMCTGERSIVDMLIEVTDAQVLDEVLNAAFDGPLHELIYGGD